MGRWVASSWSAVGSFIAAMNKEVTSTSDPKL
jgi:hypothetical protein